MERAKKEDYIFVLPVQPSGCPFVRPAHRSYVRSFHHSNSRATKGKSDRSHGTQGHVERWITFTYLSRSQRLIKETSLSSRYFHIYNFHCSHNNTIDPHDETQGQLQREVTLTYLSRSHADTGNKFAITICPHL